MNLNMAKKLAYDFNIKQVQFKLDEKQIVKLRNF